MRLNLINTIFLRLGLILLIVIFITFQSSSVSNNLNSKFNVYTLMNKDLEAVMELKDLYIDKSRNTFIYLNSGDDDDLNNLNKATKMFKEALLNTKKPVQNPACSKLLDTINKDAVDVISAQEQISEVITKRNDLVINLNKIGPDMRKKLADIMGRAHDDKDPEAAYLAGQSQERLMLARLYTNRFLNINSTKHVDRVKRELSTLNDYLSKLDKSLQNPLRRNLFADVKSNISLFESQFDELANATFTRNDLITNKYKPKSEIVEKNIIAIAKSIKEDEHSLQSEVQKTIAEQNSLFLISNLFIIAFIILLGAYLVYKIRKELRNVRYNISDIMNEIRTQIKSSNDNISTQSRSMQGSIDQTMQHNNNITNETNNLNDNLDSVSSASNEMSSTISEISSNAAGMAEQIRDIDKNADDTIQIVKKLSDEIGQIDNVIQIIEGLSEQTNLLALNAAIEAARAGDAGRGFAVVAEEVKKLASETNNATGNILSQVHSVQASSEKAAEAVDSIIRSIQNVSQTVESVANSVQEQSTATNDIATNITQSADLTGKITGIVIEINENSQQSQGAVQEMHQASVELTEQADAIESQIERVMEQLRKI